MGHLNITFFVVQSPGHFWLFATPWTAACQVSLYPSPSPKVCQVHVHCIGDGIQPSHPLTTSSSALNLCQHQGLFHLVRCLHQMTKILGVSASALILSSSMQGWFPLRLTGLVLPSKGLSEVFSITAVKRHQFFSAWPSLRSSSHNYMWPLGRP